MLDAITALEQPPLETQSPIDARAARAALVRPSRIEVEETRNLDAGGVPARLYRPPGCNADTTTGLLIWFHAGGWVLGSVDGHDDLCRSLCVRSGHTVLNVGYRLAPENPFPAGLDDAVASTCWAHDHAGELGCDPGRIAVGGDSSGANLAAVVAQLRSVPLRYQVLVYPVTDARAGYDSFRENAEGFFLTASQFTWCLDQYFSGGQGSIEDPRVSPMLATDQTVGASPDALILTAEFDAVRDDGRAYAERLATLGVPTTHVTFYGQIHSFWLFPDSIDDADAARALVAQGVKTALKPS